MQKDRHRFLALETVAVALKEAENWRREANKAVGAVMCLEKELSAERLHYAKLRDEPAGQSVAERSLAAHNETLARCFERMNAEAPWHRQFTGPSKIEETQPMRVGLGCRRHHPQRDSINPKIPSCSDPGRAFGRDGDRLLGRGAE